jgi:hypothetical protein
VLEHRQIIGDRGGYVRGRPILGQEVIWMEGAVSGLTRFSMQRSASQTLRACSIRCSPHPRPQERSRKTMRGAQVRDPCTPLHLCPSIRSRKSACTDTLPPHLHQTAP